MYSTFRNCMLTFEPCVCFDLVTLVMFCFLFMHAVASMLNNNTSTTSSVTTNPVLTNQPTSPSVHSNDPSPSGDPKLTSSVPSLGSNSDFNSQATQGGKLGAAPGLDSHLEEGLVGVKGHVTSGQVSDRPDVLNDAGQRSATGEGHSDKNENSEGTSSIARKIK